jgi:small subunit ribosomal protein S5
VARMSRNRKKDTPDDGLVERVIDINRVAKVVKGGRRFSFSAIVVVGNGDGKVGVGKGKANEVPEAIRKATVKARANLVDIPITEGTIAHTQKGRFGAGKVMLRPASPGTGVIAGPVIRAIMDAAGVHNVLTKSLGSNNANNIVRATFDAFSRMETPAQYAVRTRQSEEEVLAGYTVGSRVWRTGA